MNFQIKKPKPPHPVQESSDRPIMVSDIKKPFTFVKTNWAFFAPAFAALCTLLGFAMNRTWAEYTSAANQAAQQLILPMAARLDVQERKVDRIEAKVDVMLIDRGHDPHSIAARPE